MFGLLTFYNIYANLGENCRNKLLGNIFNISNVSVSSVSIREESIIFRLFSNGVFYQYDFLMKSGKHIIVQDDKIIDCKIYIHNDELVKYSNFIYLLVQCQNEYQIYCLLKKFL